MRLAFATVLVLLAAAPAQAAVTIVPAFDPADYADRAAVGLVVVRDGLATSGAGAADVLVSRPPGGRFERDERYPVALLGKRGLLTSDSTQLDGLVAAIDLERGELIVVPHDDPAEALERLERRIERNDSRRLPLTIALAALLIGLAVLRPAWAFRALLVALAANLWLDPLLAIAAGVAVLILPLGLACAAILTAYLVSLGIDAEAVALSPFGPSQSGRFYGVNNLLETMLLAPALVGAALLGRAGLAVAALAFVTIGGARFGADGGGIVVLAVAYLVLFARLRGLRPSWRLAALGAAAAAGLALLLLGVDAATGGASHVTDAVGDGPGALAGEIADRLEHSFRRTVAGVGAIAVVLGSLAILVAIAIRARREPVLDAFLAGLATSLLVNDTPGDVLGIGAAIAIVLVRYPPRQVALSYPAMRRIMITLIMLVLLVGAAGCGGEEEAAPLPETQEGTIPAATTEEDDDGGDTGGDTGDDDGGLEGDASAGEAVYVSAGCGGCHTMEAAGSSGTVGPNLDDTQPDAELVTDRVTNGAGAMPSFKDQLSEQQIADVSAYVAESTSG